MRTVNVEVDALTADARRGYVRAVVQAQDHAIGFYARELL